MDDKPAKSNRLPVSSLIGTFFGGLWALAGCTSFYGAARVVLMVTAGAITSVLLLRSIRHQAAAPLRNHLFHRWPYLIAVMLEAAAIGLAGALLPKVGFTPYLIEVVGIIVGLHFIGLWKASQSSRFLMISLGICVLSASAMAAQLTLESIRTGLALTGFGNALVLWVGANPPNKAATSKRSTDEN